MNTRSLRFQLIGWYAGVLTGTFLVFGAAMFFGVKFFLERSTKVRQIRRAHQIAETFVSQLNETGAARMAENIKTLYDPENLGRYIRIMRSDGNILYLSGKPRDESFDPTGLPPLANPWLRESARKEVLTDGKELAIAAVLYQSPGGETFLVESGVPFGAEATMLRHLLVTLVIGLPVMVSVAAICGYVLVGRALEPVVTIARSAEQITSHNLKERLPIVQTGDELERLANAVNHMIARLDEALENNRRFLADASHELRTPLTALRGELETLVPQPTLAPMDREWVGSALEEVDRLTKIVETLFAISRLDAGEAQAEWVRFDLAKLAVSTAEQMSLLAEDRGIALACDAGEDVNVQGDRARIKQVIVNLLDNAIKYTPEGGRIQLTVTAQNARARLEVSDTGIGIPPEALPYVFDRFFRVDKVRSREEGGAGLGLSIVKSICTANAGHVEVTSEPGRGSRFKVEFPLLEVGPSDHSQIT